MTNAKKIPMRKCVATNEMKSKRDMIRIVRTTEGEIVIDLTGKENGRGAYLTLSTEAILQAKKRRLLQTHLEAAVDEDIFNQLLTMVAKE